MASTNPIIKEVLLEATPEEVFAYLTQSGRYLEWMGVSAELDPRPGGIFRIDPNGSGRDAIRGTFVEVTRPTRVVFTWGHAAGWQHYLERLRARVDGRDPGPDALADPRFRHSV